MATDAPWENDAPARGRPPASPVNDAAPWEADTAAPTDAAPDEPVRSTLERVVEGMGQGAADLAAGFGHVGTSILAPYDLAADAVQGRPLGTGNRERRGSVQGFAAEHGANNLTSAINQAVPEVMATGAPIAGVERAVATALPRYLARPAGVLADVGVNSLYAGADAAARSENVPEAMKWGAAGAAGGRVAGRLVGGPLRNVATQEARQLADAGVLSTPGQALGGFARRAEDAATSIPGYGDTVLWARGRAANNYANAEVNRAIAPLGVTVRGGDEAAVGAANEAVQRAYDTAIPRTFLDPAAGRRAVTEWIREDFTQSPLLTDAQRAQLARYVQQKIAPLVSPGAQRVNGDLVKRIDSELGYLARTNSRSVNPGDRPLGEAFGALQQRLRASLGSTDATALADLRAANDAYRRMLPINRASGRAAAQSGQFTPWQFNRAAGQFNQNAGPLNAAARRVLPSTVPDSGTARRIITGGGAAAAGMATQLLAGGVLGLVVNNPVGLRYMVHGVPGVAPGLRSMMNAATRAWFDHLPPHEQMRFVQRAAGDTPVGAALAAQVGRALATSQPQEETQP